MLQRSGAGDAPPPGNLNARTSVRETLIKYWLRNAVAPQDEPLRWTGFPA
ncbi:MAG: hypothetical protein HC862_02590 [Scytonema sp. RU_4_4]|nr:hypothetical protein [Scytonema sp. RU_4_4]NJR73174.1 hypothetical protein [Scytonema sp. CRU_2_7]